MQELIYLRIFEALAFLFFAIKWMKLFNLNSNENISRIYDIPLLHLVNTWFIHYEHERGKIEPWVERKKIVSSIDYEYNKIHTHLFPAVYRDKRENITWEGGVKLFNQWEARKRLTTRSIISFQLLLQL